MIYEIIQTTPSGSLHTGADAVGGHVAKRSSGTKRTEDALKPSNLISSTTTHQGMPLHGPGFGSTQVRIFIAIRIHKLEPTNSFFRFFQKTAMAEVFLTFFKMASHSPLFTIFNNFATAHSQNLPNFVGENF